MHEPGLLVAGSSQDVRRMSAKCFVIGDIFAGAARDEKCAIAAPPDRSSFTSYCRELTATRWGSYLAIWNDCDARSDVTLFRDPIGMRECVRWQHSGILFITNEPGKWLPSYPPDDFDIDLEEVRQIVAFPSAVADAEPLRGVKALEAGLLTRLAGPESSQQRLWAPRTFCSRSESPAAAPEMLSHLVDSCVMAWRSGNDRAVVELSGGLDSAIIAASLVKAGSLAEAFTFYSHDLPGDERRFSREIAVHLAISNTEIVLGPEALDASRLSSTVRGWRPGIGSTSLFHDAVLASHAQTIGARQLFTGRGGDAVFFQHPSVLVAAEPSPDGRAGFLKRLEPMARWCRTSVWAVACAALTRNLSALEPARASRFLASPQPRPRSLRWAGDLNGLTPAKQMQIHGIAAERNAFGPSHCSQVLDVIHPLLSQPLVEFALAQSLLVLTDGRRDRALARAAFVNRLPQGVLSRRGKGSLTGYFGQVLARSVPLLRQRLLEGRLCRAGLLNRPALELASDENYLLQFDCYAELLTLLEIEDWFEHWRMQIDRLGRCSRHLAP
ncbi:asparagine synthase-related protein [Novosphingobium sp. 9U]|uniref:asparagine synthase-related protein n=1 Tax=Novosphingobium sp. 9U TaxID=2653158 RepID=UPI00135BE139|nr:asparagine synthase-related protein [Novosphingobium sp. 9U]